MIKKIKVDEITNIELIYENHSQSIFELIDSNRANLREWLPFVDRMQTVEYAENFVN